MADRKITELTTLTSLADSDLFLVIDDPSGTPLSRALRSDDLRAYTSTYYDTTPAETAATVTPVNFQYEPGDLRRYGADGDGTDDKASIDDAAEYVGSGAAGAVLVKGESKEYGTSGAIQFNYADTLVVGDGVQSFKGLAATPVVQSLLVDREVAGSIRGLIFRDFVVDGNDIATIGIDLERFTRRCSIQNVDVNDVDGTGVKLSNCWSYGLQNVRVNGCATDGFLLADANNAFSIAGVWSGNNGADQTNGKDHGLVIENAQGGSITGSTFEYNHGPNASIAGRGLLIAGNYIEGHINNASREEDGVVLGSSTEPFLDGFFWNYVNGGSNSGASFSGDGVSLTNVVNSFLKATFSASTRHEYKFAQTDVVKGNIIHLNSNAEHAATAASIVRDLTGAVSGDATVLQGTNVFNNESRITGDTTGLRYTYQIKPNDTAGSLFENRLAWGGATKWRWGKLSTSGDAFAIANGSETLAFWNADEVRFAKAYDATTVDAANVVVASDGQLLRSTSSGVFKSGIEDIDQSYTNKIIDQLRPVYYRSVCDADNPEWSWWGLIAEEVAEVDPRLVSWQTKERVVRYEDVEVTPAVYDDNGLFKPPVFERRPVDEWRDLETPVPEGVNYTAIIPHLIGVIKRQNKKIQDIEARLAALEK